MATAEIKTTAATVTLTLSLEEALVIAAFTGGVCGIDGPQCLTTTIYKALDKLGLGYPYKDQGSIKITPMYSGWKLEWRKD